MHDPMTVAFEIKSPRVKRVESGWKFRDTLVTIWHVDPEKDGSDDSCNFLGFRRTREQGWYPSTTEDYEQLSPDAQAAVSFIWFNFIARMRPWYKHPRWHVHHWKIQVHGVQNLKRWLFSRCAGCGKRFRWGYAPVSTGQSYGPRWFHGEKGIYHHECDRTPKIAIMEAASDPHPVLSITDAARVAVAQIAEKWNHQALEIVRAKAERPDMSIEEIVSGTHDACGKPWIEHTLVLSEVAFDQRLIAREGDLVVRPADYPVDLHCPGEAA